MEAEPPAQQASPARRQGGTPLRSRSPGQRPPDVWISLQDFDENKTEPPYLTSPRSLEACQRHGIEPDELVRK